MSDLRTALSALLDHYVALVDSGDAGHWNTEEEHVVKRARAALAAEPEPKRGPGWCDIHQHYKPCEHNTAQPLTEDQAAAYRRTGTVCTGNCNQGRRPCTDDCGDAEFGPLSCRILYYSIAIIAIACVVVIVI